MGRSVPLVCERDRVGAATPALTATGTRLSSSWRTWPTSITSCDSDNYTSPSTSFPACLFFAIVVPVIAVAASFFARSAASARTLVPVISKITE